METASGGDKPNNAFRPSLRFAKVFEKTRRLYLPKNATKCNHSICIHHKRASVNIFYEGKHFLQVTSKSVDWYCVFTIVFSTYLNSALQKGDYKLVFTQSWITAFSFELCPAACLQTSFSSLLFWFLQTSVSFLKEAVKLTIVIFSPVTLDVIERDERSALISLNHIEQLKWRASLKENLQYQITWIDIVTATFWR